MNRVLGNLATVVIGFLVGGIVGGGVTASVFLEPTAKANGAIAAPFVNGQSVWWGGTKEMTFLKPAPGTPVGREPRDAYYLNTGPSSGIFTYREMIHGRFLSFPCPPSRGGDRSCVNDLLAADEMDLQGSRLDWVPFQVCADFPSYHTCRFITDLFPEFPSQESK